MASVSVAELDDLSKMILYAINSTGGRRVNETHLQKIMFQIVKVMSMDPKVVGYRPHRYGPYSDRVNEEKRSLQTLGFIDVADSGMRIRAEVSDEVSSIKLPEVNAYKVEMISEYLSSLNNDELLLLIYHDDILYDNGYYLENSDIKKQVMDKRITTALGMYEGNKTTLERSSELAGMNIRDFRKLLIDTGRYHYDD